MSGRFNLWRLCQIADKDYEIARNYRAAAHIADMYLAGRITWEETQKRWAFIDLMKLVYWRERRALSHVGAQS